MKNSATNSANMKAYNRRLILNIIRKKPVSRAELARITGLSRAAVTIIVDDLLNEGILMETGTMEADYGRKPILLDLNPDSFYAVGVSIAREDCHTGVLNFKGEMLAKRRVKTESCHDAAACINAIAADIKGMVADLALTDEKLLGIGINAPGPVDINSGTILTPPNFNQWHNIGIVQELKRKIHADIFLENNSAALALAEQSYGRGAEFGSFMLLIVDRGIGAGIVINDHLYRGVNGFGSEVGHTSIDINGKTCNCGNKGCLEVYASVPSVLDFIDRNEGDAASWKEVVDKAEAGDDLCIEAIDREALFLSTGIVNAMNILELEAVILTGDIIYKPGILLDKIRRNVENSAITRYSHKLQIMQSSIVENSEIISAASIIIDRFFKGESKKD